MPQAAYAVLQQIGQAMVADQWSSVPMVGAQIAPETPGFSGYTVGLIEVVSVVNSQQPSQVVAVIHISEAADNANEVIIQLQPSGTWALTASEM
jgi:hypothetical protein